VLDSRLDGIVDKSSDEREITIMGGFEDKAGVESFTCAKEFTIVSYS